MKISAKQDNIAAAIHAGYKQILLEGAIGTSKTYGAAMAMLTIANEYPGSHVYVARKNMTELKRTTLLSFREAAADMGMVENYHYTENNSANFWQLKGQGANPSYVHFIEADHTKDRQFTKIKGLNMTCLFVDEADGIIEDAYNMLASRTGRANKNGAPDFVLLACNANETWVKDRFYDPFKGINKKGPLPTDTTVIEFEIADSFLGMAYYSKFDNNPLQWRQRYLYNNWEYGDDTYSLFKYRHMDSVHVSTFKRGTRSLSVDAGRTHDRTVVSLWDNMCLVDIVIIKDLGETMEYEEQAQEIYDYATNNGVGWENIDVDAVGEGQGLITAFKTMFNWVVNPFVSNSTPDSKIALERKLARASSLEEKQRIRREHPIVFKDLRSEHTYLLSQGIEAGTVTFWDGCPYLGNFKKEATMHNHTTDNGVLTVEAKEKVKARTGQSPDIFDSVMMGYRRQLQLTYIGSYGQHRNRKTERKHDDPIRTARKKTFTGGLYKKQF